MGVDRVSQGHQVFLAWRVQCLTQSYHEVASAGHRRDPFRIQVLHQLRSCLRVVVARPQLANMIVSPAIHAAINSQGHAEAVPDFNLLRFSFDLLHAVRRQELAESARAPQKQTPCVI